MRRHRTPALLIATLTALAVVMPAAAAPEAVPDRLPGLSEVVERGELVVESVSTRPVTPKVVDGDISDWTGTSAMIAGQSHMDAGELIHTDFVWDAHGADAGEDVARWNTFAGLLHEEPRGDRIDDLLRTLDMQLGVPYPVGADEMYGNANGDLSVGDIHEVRLAADADTLFVLLRMGVMTPDTVPGVLLLADREPFVGTLGDPSLGLREDHRFDQIIGVGTGTVADRDDLDVAVNDDGYVNAIEIAVPLHLVTGVDGTLDLSVVTGAAGDGVFTPHNIAFRGSEPVDIYTDLQQAFALHGDAPQGSHVDDFSTGPVDPADLRAGVSQVVRPGPGYHERHMLSGEEISRESGRDGIRQPYGLYVPSDYDPSPDVATPTTFWLHYRGGKAHSGATINPRMIHELAREDLWRTDGTPGEGLPIIGGQQGNLVVTPHARGTSYWYVSQSHQDFFEVFADVHALIPNIDPQRRYLAGYSMGGYGTYLMGLLYPDLFAAGFPVAGAVTQGAWTGVKDSPVCDVEEPFSGDDASGCYIQANGGDASAQLTYRLLENARHLPLHIDHGTDDELVPVSGVEAMAARLVELGYRVEMQLFPGYEHFTQAAVDEFADGAAYLQRFASPENPRHVTYKVVPALIEAVNTIRTQGWQQTQRFDFDPDGAWWVDDIVVRDADPHDDTAFGLVDAEATAIAEPQRATVPVTGTASPGHSTPFVRHGLDWVDLPVAEPTSPGVRIDLTGVASVTIDGQRAQISPRSGAPSCSTLTTDGPATVTITGISDVTSFAFGTSSGGLLGGPTSGEFVTGTFSGDTFVAELEGAGTWFLDLANDATTGGC